MLTIAHRPAHRPAHRLAHRLPGRAASLVLAVALVLLLPAVLTARQAPTRSDRPADRPAYPGLELRRPAAGTADPRDTLADGEADDGAAAGSVAPRERRRVQGREFDRLRRRAEFERGRPSPLPRRPGERPPPAPRSPLAVPSSGGFRVMVETDLEEYVVDEADADPIRIFVTAEVDGYLTLVSAGLGPEVTLLAPDDLLAEVPIRAGETLEFPFPEWQQRGIELRAVLPRGVDESQQTVIAIVTRRPVELPLPWTGYDARTRGSATIPSRIFQQWLASIPVRQRGVAQTLFLVRAR